MKNPQIVKELYRIQQQNTDNLLLPADVVNHARHQKNPLHSHFIWDDTKAAEEHRLWQARKLIASVEIVMDDRKERGPAFVSLSIDRRSSGGYRSTSDVIGNADLSNELLSTATAELNNFQLRYRRLSALAGVFREIKRLKRKPRNTN